MSTKAERCWYCGERRAELWCDYMLGSVLAQDRCEWDPALGQPAVLDGGCKNTATLVLGSEGNLRTCDTCASLPGLRRYRKRIPISAPVEVVQTCDAGACSTCARQFGWRRRGHICCSPRSKSQTIDHCHVHAQADGLGSSAWIGAPAIAVLRSDVRTACVRAHAALSTCPKEQNV